MNFKEIIELIEKVAEHGLAGVEIERAGTKIRIEGKSSQPQVIHSYASEPRTEQQPQHERQAHAPSPTPAAVAAAARQAEEDSEAGLHIITAPIVGTFYRTPNPESDAFVSVGDRVSKGKVLCIIEAMKLMNEIECDSDGTLVKIYPQNGQPVEYGEKLFAVRP